MKNKEFNFLEEMGIQKMMYIPVYHSKSNINGIGVLLLLT